MSAGAVVSLGGGGRGFYSNCCYAWGVLLWGGEQCTGAGLE